MNASAFLNFLKTRDDILAKNEIIRKQEEYRNALVRHQSSGRNLALFQNELILNENKIRDAYAGDAGFQEQFDEFKNMGFSRNLNMDFFEKVAREDLIGMDFAQFSDYVGFTQAATGSAGNRGVELKKNKNGNYSPVLLNMQGGVDGESQVIAPITEDAKPFQFGGIALEVSPDSMGYFLGSYLRKLGETTFDADGKRFTTMQDLRQFDAARTGRTNIGDLTNTDSGNTPADLTPGPLLSKVINEERSLKDMTPDELAAIVNDPYFRAITEGQSIKSIDDLGDVSSMADEGLYSGANRKIIEKAWREFEESGGPNATAGKRNKNPLNIRYNASNDWFGRDRKEGTPEGFETFISTAHGVRAADKVLENYSEYGINSVREVINRFAPPNENDTDGYVDFVAKELGIGADDRINLRNPQTRTELLKAMVQMESPDVTLTDDQIASARLLNEDNYRALTTGKSKPGGGYETEYKGNTLTATPIPRVSYSDPDGFPLFGDDLFNEIMGSFTGVTYSDGRERDLSVQRGATSGTLTEGLTPADYSDIEDGGVRTTASILGTRQGTVGVVGGREQEAAERIFGEDAIVVKRSRYSNYFHDNTKIPLGMGKEQWESLNDRQKDQLNMKSKAVSVANKQRLDNAITSAQNTYTPQNQSFYDNLTEATRTSVGTGKSVKRYGKSTRLTEFFASNPEYSREFSSIGPKAFAEKYQNDEGFKKNFPTKEQIRETQAKIKNITTLAANDIADILITHTDPNTERAQMNFLSQKERFSILSGLYHSGSALVTQDSFGKAAAAFMAGEPLDIAFASSGALKLASATDPASKELVPAGAQPNKFPDHIEAIIERFNKGTPSQYGAGNNFVNATVNNIFDSDRAKYLSDPDSERGRQNLTDRRALLSYMEENFLDQAATLQLNRVIDALDTQRLVGLADVGVDFKFLGVEFGDRDIESNQFVQTQAEGLRPTLSVQLNFQGRVYNPGTFTEAMLYMTNGAKFHSYQFIGDDGQPAGKRVLAANMNDLDKKHALILLGDGANKNNSGDSRTKLYADELTQDRIAKEAGE